MALAEIDRVLAARLRFGDVLAHEGYQDEHAVPGLRTRELRVWLSVFRVFSRCICRCARGSGR